MLDIGEQIHCHLVWKGSFWGFLWVLELEFASPSELLFCFTQDLLGSTFAAGDLAGPMALRHPEDGSCRDLAEAGPGKLAKNGQKNWKSGCMRT